MSRELRRGRSKLVGTPVFMTAAHRSDHGTRTLLYTRNGTLTAVAGQDLTFPRGAEIISFWMNLEGAPSGGSFTCDVTIDAVTIFGGTDIPTITTGNKEMDEVFYIGGHENFVNDTDTVEIVPVLINGASGLQVWLEVDMGESDGGDG